MHSCLSRIAFLPLFALLWGCSSSDEALAETPSADASSDTPAVDAAVDASPEAGEDSSTVDPEQSSKGSGGILCESKASLDTIGHSACLSTAIGTQFKLTEPVGASGPAYLGIYLHGDGAGAYNSNSAVKRMLELADKKNMLLIAVLAPNKCAWWQKPDKVFDAGCTSKTEDPDTAGLNAKALADVIEAVRSAYDVRNDPYLYYTASGGSIFLTGSFYPQYGNKYPGGMAVNCGGVAAKDSSYQWDVKNTGLRGSTKLFFTYGDKDFLAADSHASFLYFQGLGFPVDEKIIANAEHCAFDGHARALEVWTAFLGL